MKRLQKGEHLGLKLKTQSGLANVVLNEVAKLDVDESLLVDNLDWKLSTTPSSYVHSRFKKTDREFRIKTLADNAGWVIIRTK